MKSKSDSKPPKIFKRHRKQDRESRRTCWRHSSEIQKIYKKMIFEKQIFCPNYLGQIWPRKLPWRLSFKMAKRNN